MIKAERIECALHDRTFGLSLEAKDQSWRGILLTSGSGKIISNARTTPIAANNLVWAPWAADMVLRISAGSVGSHLSVGAAALADAIGHGAEAMELRILSARQRTIDLDPESRDATGAFHAFELIVEEARARRIATNSMVAAQLRAILVILLRNASDPEMLTKGIGRTARSLQVFRQLTETHFRERWPVARYAAEIGITADRLHDLCTRHLGRAPKRLLQELVLHEARQMLSSTPLTIDQISASLGYRDPGHFSRMFKSETGLPPATFRKLELKGKNDLRGAQEPDFSDWP